MSTHLVGERWETGPFERRRVYEITELTTRRGKPHYRLFCTDSSGKNSLRADIGQTKVVAGSWFDRAGEPEIDLEKRG